MRGAQSECLTRQHTRVNGWNFCCGAQVALTETVIQATIMPIMLFYLPMILWAGLFNVAQAELTPVPAKARNLPPPRR